MILRAAELLVAANAIAGCRRSDGLYEEPHQVSDPVVPPCVVTTQPFHVKGYWLILDGTRGVLLEGLPADIVLQHETRRALGGTFVVPDGQRIRIESGAPQPGPCEGQRSRDIVIPEDGPFDVPFP